MCRKSSSNLDANKKSYLLLMFFFLLIGCQQPIQTFESVYANYSIGVPRTASIGSPIIKVSNGKFANIFVYEALFSIDIEFRPFRNIMEQDVVRIKKGEIFKVYRDYGQTLILSTTSNAKKPTYIFIENDGQLQSILNEKLDKNTVIGQISKDTLFRKLQDKVLINNEYTFELILTEVSTDRISAIYREYSSDYIKPAFSYPVTFNIKESKILRFQSIVIEILNIYDNQVEYLVSADK